LLKCIVIDDSLIQEAQLMLTNPHDAFRGQSRSPNIVPFHMLGFLLVFCSNYVHKRIVSEIFDFEKCRDLKIRVKGHSRSSEPTRIDPQPMTSYYRSIVTMGLSRIASKINGYFSNFSLPRVFCAHANGVPLGIGYRRKGSRKLEWWGYRAEQEVWRYLQPTVSTRLKIPSNVLLGYNPPTWRTDRRSPNDSKDRDYA